jgi:hypothetical protein
MSGEAGAYTTLLYPYASFETRIPESFFSEGRMSAGGWTIRTVSDGEIEVGGYMTDARLILEHAGGVILIGATQVTGKGKKLERDRRFDAHLAYDTGEATFLEP